MTKRAPPGATATGLGEGDGLAAGAAFAGKIGLASCAVGVGLAPLAAGEPAGGGAPAGAVGGAGEQEIASAPTRAITAMS